MQILRSFETFHVIPQFHFIPREVKISLKRNEDPSSRDTGQTCPNSRQSAHTCVFRGYSQSHKQLNLCYAAQEQVDGQRKLGARSQLNACISYESALH